MPDLMLPKKPSEQEAEKTTVRTKKALEKIIESKISAAMPVRRVEKGPAQYLRYTPSQQGKSFNSRAKQCVIRMMEAQTDPIEPPKFKINKKIPRGPASPPAPVVHSPTKKVTIQEQKNWKIPPCISDWKNAKGYTIPLDKRLAVYSRLQQFHINEGFAKLAEAMYIADRKARKAVEMRAQLEKKLTQKEKEKKEDHLRHLAKIARNERAGLKTAVIYVSEEIKERDLLRQKRHKDRASERNLARAAPDKRSRLQRERDISEQIALGMPAKNVGASVNQVFDQRLYNTTKGMDSGYGHDDKYNVYDKPWIDVNSLANHLYKPSKNFDEDNYGEDVEKLKSTNRFIPDKEFCGTDRTAAARFGPVQFEKEEEDLFGLDQFLKRAKKS